MTGSVSDVRLRFIYPHDINDPIRDALRADAVAYWKMDTGAGGYVLDSTGKYNLPYDGTIVFSNGFLLFGNDGFLDLISNIFSVGGASFTLGIEISALASNGDFEISFSTAFSNRYEFGINPAAASSFYFNITDDGGSESVLETDIGSISAGQVYVVFYSYNHVSKQKAIEVNLVSTTQDASAQTISSRQITEIYIPGDNSKIRRMGFWNRLLSSPERTYLYNNGNGVSLFP